MSTEVYRIISGIEKIVSFPAEAHEVSMSGSATGGSLMITHVFNVKCPVMQQHVNL